MEINTINEYFYKTIPLSIFLNCEPFHYSDTVKKQSIQVKCQYLLYKLIL